MLLLYRTLKYNIMAKNIHFNEFDLEINNFGVYQLKCVEPFKKRLHLYDEESVWKFVTKRDLKSKSIIDEISYLTKYIFFHS